MALSVYGDIAPRTAAHAVRDLLRRALPYLCIEKFGQSYVLDNNSTTSAKFRRYEALPLATVPLVEGVTPNGRPLSKTDVTATLVQYGDWVELTDVIQDAHEDKVLGEYMMILGEQAAQTLEAVRWGVLRGGTNVFYANGGARNAVNTTLTLSLQRKCTRALMNQNASLITSVSKSTPDWGSQSIEAAYIAIGHTNIDAVVRGLTGYVNPKNYTFSDKWANEIGAVENVRYLSSTLFTPFADAGGAAGGNFLSTTGTNCDVYPIIFIARDAYAVVPLKGQNSITPMVVNPSPSKGDPLGQRGSVGWKAMQATVILNDAFLVRAEVAIPLNP